MPFISRMTDSSILIISVIVVAFFFSFLFFFLFFFLSFFLNFYTFVVVVALYGVRERVQYKLKENNRHASNN